MYLCCNLYSHLAAPEEQGHATRISSLFFPYYFEQTVAVVRCLQIFFAVVGTFIDFMTMNKFFWTNIFLALFFKFFLAEVVAESSEDLVQFKEKSLVTPRLCVFFRLLYRKFKFNFSPLVSLLPQNDAFSSCQRMKRVDTTSTERTTASSASFHLWFCEN